MLVYPLNDNCKIVVRMMLADPILSALIDEYELDENNLYIPKCRIKNKLLLEKFIKSGLIHEVD